MDLNSWIASALEDIFARAPGYLEAQHGAEVTNTRFSILECCTWKSCGHTNRQSTSSGNVLQPTVSAQPPGQVSNSRPSLQAQGTTAAQGIVGTSAGTQSSSQIANPRHVYLCVKTGAQYHFAGLEAHQLVTDVDLFSALKREYFSAKKGVLHWLSIWRYDHCKFFEVRLRHVPS